MTRLAILAASTILVALPALAQSTAPADAPTGVGPGDRTGSITSVGQTKPPGTAAAGSTTELEQKSRELDRKIDKDICTGCK